MRRRVKEHTKSWAVWSSMTSIFRTLTTIHLRNISSLSRNRAAGKLIPEGMCNPGQVYGFLRKSGMIGVFRLESQMLPGNGKFERDGTEL